MVTVICTDDDCPNGNVQYNVPGEPSQVECGGCGVMLTPTDLRDDPPLLGPGWDAPEPPAV